MAEKEENVLNLNKALGTTKQSIDSLVGAVDKLGSSFDGLSKKLRIDAYVELNSTYTKLTRNLILTTIEAEKFSRTIDLLAKRTQYYSKQELANMQAMFVKTTGFVSSLGKEFEHLSERFANKYKKDADIYAKSFIELTERFPELSIAMKKGATDAQTLAQIMKVSGREGVSAYLTAIDKIPDETENAINKAELSIKKMRKSWDDAKVGVGQSIYDMFNPLFEMGTKLGNFAESNPGLVSLTTLFASIGTPVAMGQLQKVLSKKGTGGASAVSSVVAEKVATSSSWNTYNPHKMADVLADGITTTGTGLNVYSPKAAKTIGMGTRLGLGAGAAATFIGGHALTQNYTDEGTMGRTAANFGTNILSATLAGGAIGGLPGAAIGAAAGAVITAFSELQDASKKLKEEMEGGGEGSPTRRKDLIDLDRRLSENKMFEKAGLKSEREKFQAGLNLTGKETQLEASTKTFDYSQNIGKIVENIPKLREEAVKIQKQANEEYSVLIARKQENERIIAEGQEGKFRGKGGGIEMFRQMAIAKNELDDPDFQRKLVEAEIKNTGANQNVDQLREYESGMQSEQAKNLNLARQQAEKAFEFEEQRKGLTSDKIQQALSFGLNDKALPAELTQRLTSQISAKQTILDTQGDMLDPQEKERIKRDLYSLNIQKEFGVADTATQLAMGESALTARGALGQAALKSAQGGTSLSEIVAMQRGAGTAQLEVDIAKKKEQIDATSSSSPQGIAKRKQLQADVYDMELQKLKLIAESENRLLQARQYSISAQEKINQLYNPQSPKAILDIMEKQLQLVKERKTVTEDEAVAKENELKALGAQLEFYKAFGQEEAKLQQRAEILQTERGAFGVTGATTKGDLLAISMETEQKRLKAMEEGGADEFTTAPIKAKIQALQIQKQINDEIEKASEINQFDLSITDKQIQRMQTLRAPIGVIAALNRQKLSQNKEALAIAERELEIAQKSKDLQAARVAQQKVEDVKNAIASSIDFERRSYAEMFTETTFGRLGHGTYLFPNDVSKFATMGSGYTTGWSGYGKQGGTYQTQIGNMFGPGVDERTSIEKLYGSLINDGIKIKEGATFKIVGIENGTATVIKEADKP